MISREPRDGTPALHVARPDVGADDRGLVDADPTAARDAAGSEAGKQELPVKAKSGGFGEY